VASDQETRDTALLGVAALAIAAAAGIAYQRRRELS
jgi:MYXO-CTERM domain-containing protein